MAKIIKTFKTIRNHWKKSTFACVLGYYGIEFAKEKRREFLMMRELCVEAGKNGKLPLPIGASNKHITLFLNPAASGRKSRQKFEKFSEPLLHMAGFLVTVIRTERIDEAKELTSLIQKTNMIAVAGGDGTLSEVITGLLRREDASEASRIYPIGIIPVGNDNEFASTLLGDGEAKQPRQIADSTMSIVKHQVKPKDVMEIQVLDSPEVTESAPLEDLPEPPEDSKIVEKTPPKPVYAMSGLRLGTFREGLKRKAELPTLLGEYFTTFWAFLRTNPEVFKAEIRYTPACEGCLKCVKDEPLKTQSASLLSRVASIFRPRQAQEVVKKPLVENENCGIWTSMCVDTPEFNIKSENDGSLVMEIGKQLNKTDVLLQGLNIISKTKDTIAQKIKFNEAEIIPIESPQFCSIDGDEFEVKPLHIRLLRKKLLFFVPT